MAEIKNPEAYFCRMIQNLDKNDYRANDNYYNHVSSVGNLNDIQRECGKHPKRSEHEANTVERQLSENNAENWLLFMEDERLHLVMSSLPTDDVEFLLELAKFRFRKAAYAKEYGVSQQAVSKHFHRLRKKIFESMEIGL